MPRATERRIDRGEDDVPRRPRAVGDVALAPVYDPVLPIFSTARADRRDVAPRARLRERVGPPLELRRHVFEDPEEALFLRRRPARANGGPSETRAGHGEQQDAVAPGHLFGREDRRQARAALLLRGWASHVGLGVGRRAEAAGEHRQVAEKVLRDAALPVPLEGFRTNDRRGKPVDRLPHLVLPAGEREIDHARFSCSSG